MCSTAYKFVWPGSDIQPYFSLPEEAVKTLDTKQNVAKNYNTKPIENLLLAPECRIKCKNSMLNHSDLDHSIMNFSKFCKVF